MASTSIPRIGARLRLGLPLGLAITALTIPALTVPPLALADPPPPDHAAIITLNDENASISSSSLPDRYYVNGARISYTSGEGDLPDFMKQFGYTLWGDGRQRISIDLTQLIFTPANTNARYPSRTDEPYAGVLLAGVSLIEDTRNTRNIIEVQAGVVGPGAGAEQVQNGFHDIISQSHTNGWCCYQIKNEPAVELTAERIWRVPLVRDFGGFESDVLPSVTGGLGNVKIYAMAGAVVRFGQGLESDYGVARVRPAMTGGDAFTPVLPFSWYVFAGFDGQAIGRDITLDGNSFQSSPNVPSKTLVGDVEAGAAIMYGGVRVTFTEAAETNTFRGQRGGLHQVGSILASVRF